MTDPTPSFHTDRVTDGGGLAYGFVYGPRKTLTAFHRPRPASDCEAKFTLIADDHGSTELARWLTRAELVALADQATRCLADWPETVAPVSENAAPEENK